MQTELRPSPTATVAEKTQAPLHIDLLRQDKIRPGKYSRYAAPFGVAVAALLLVLLYVNFTWLNLGISLLVLLQVYNLGCTLSGRRAFRFMKGAAYLTLNPKGVAFKQAGQRPVMIDWAEKTHSE